MARSSGHHRLGNVMPAQVQAILTAEERLAQAQADALNEEAYALEMAGAPHRTRRRKFEQDQHFAQDAEAFAGASAPDTEGEGGEAEQGFMLEELLQWDGNIAELFQDSEEGKRKLNEIGALVVREYEFDKSSRKDWEASARTALETAGQKKGEKKTYPFDGAADVRFPLLTTASIQFAARAYPNIVRGDEVVAVKIAGEDADSAKAERAERVAAFANDQIIYQCPEWEIGTDQLLHQLPITGAGFRKVYWDESLKRPRFDYAPALKVILPIDAPSIEMSPRVSHELDVYPYDYEKKVGAGTWLKCDLRRDTADSQKQVLFIEQCRYLDMDEDGLSEPYLVTVHKDSGAVVRIDPAFGLDDVKRYPPSDDGTPGKIYCIERLLPWVDYCFLPDPEGGAYGIGFGKLLEAISDTVNTLLNQMIDAGHLANTNTGFIGAGFKTRGGTLTLEPNAFKMLEGVANVREAIHRLEFPGPNAVAFNLIDMLLGAAKDITAIKDVLTGEMPGGQHVAEGTVMAMIEQGLQVFTSIYKRIYRSMRREFELQCRLNARYLDPADYQKFLDARPKPAPQAQNAPPLDPRLQIGANGGPPLTPQDMGAGMPMDGAGLLPDAMAAPGMPMPQQAAPAMGAPPMAQGGAVVPFPVQQQMAPPPDPRVDFNPDDLDIRPVADPTAITDMQRMAKAQFKLQFLNDPAVNRVKVLQSVWKDARIANVEEYIVERNPALEQQAQIDTAQKMATVKQTEADANLKVAQAEKLRGEIANAPEDRMLRQRELDQRDREMNQRDIELSQKRDQAAVDQFKADMDDADREVRFIMEASHRDRELSIEDRKVDVMRAARTQPRDGDGDGERVE